MICTKGISTGIFSKKNPFVYTYPCNDYRRVTNPHPVCIREILVTDVERYGPMLTFSLLLIRLLRDRVARTFSKVISRTVVKSRRRVVAPV